MLLEASSVQTMADKQKGRRFALLFANSIPRIGTYISLASAIQSQGHTAVVVIPKSVKLTADELVGFEDVPLSNMTASQIRALNGIDLFFSSEQVHDVAPENAVTVGVLHSLPDTGIQSHRIVSNAARFFEVNPAMIRTFDYVIVAVRQLSTHWSVENYSLVNGFYPSVFLKKRRPVIDIVPAGYPKLDYSRRILKSDEPADSILYTPTACRHPLSRVRKDGEEILRTLIAGFPDMNIVLRPYPSEEDLAFGRELAHRLSQVTNFILDDTSTGVVFQRRAAIAVTDNSSSAMTFSMATGRPMISTRLEGKASDVPERSLFGLSASSKDALLNATRTCLEGSIDWSAEIAERADEHLYNPGGAGDYIAERLELMAERSSDPDWLTVSRKPWIPTNVERDVPEHLELLETWRKRAPKGRADAACLEISEYLRMEYR